MEWKITKVEHKDIGSKKDVCIASYFVCSKTVEEGSVEEGNFKSFSASHANSISLNTDDLDDYIDYYNVTEEQIIAWTKVQLTDKMITAIENNIDGQISKQKTPTVKHGSPWNEYPTGDPSTDWKLAQLQRYCDDNSVDYEDGTNLDEDGDVIAANSKAELVELIEAE